MPDTSQETHYNPLYERFVDPSASPADRLTGYIAYGLYKEAKREWASNLFVRKERKPNEDELSDYLRTGTDSRIRGVREQADGALANFATSVVEDSRASIREATLKEALAGSAWKTIGLSIAASALYTLVLIVGLVILRLVGVDLISILVSLTSIR